MEIKNIETKNMSLILKEIKNNFNNALPLVDEIVLKNYISDLTDLDIYDLELDEKRKSEELDKIRLFKINKITYKKNENSLYKYGSILSSIANLGASLVTIINGKGEKTDIYIGIKHNKDMGNISNKILNKTLEGQFLGSSIERIYKEDIQEIIDFSEKDKKLICSITTGIANNKNMDFIDNEKYIQGLEKFIMAMQGQEYSAVILASPVSIKELNQIKINYEDMYTQLSAFSNMVVNNGKNTNESFTKGINLTKTKTETLSESVSESKFENKFMAGNAGVSIQMKMANLAAGGSSGSGEGKGKTDTKGKSSGESKSEGSSESSSNSSGSSQSLQLTVQNKKIRGILDKIDKQLERINEFESFGMWKSAAYFLSEDLSASITAASTYKSLISGENSGIEKSAINTWLAKETEKNNRIAKYLTILEHPRFNKENIEVLPTSMMSSNELAIAMGLPRKSVPGFIATEHAEFGKEVATYSKKNNKNVESVESIEIANIYNMGKESELKIELDRQSLAMHTFITGSTGSGKSNTVYTILNKLNEKGIKFLVIEPAKGEYKHVFGHNNDVNVYGTNPEYTELLKINPFRFPEKIHVLEHIDRLIDIFNVCWPMYAAMPAILKEAIETTYKKSGWDLISSKNNINSSLFPTFIDLLESLREVINNSEYSKEIKDNYTGSLITRVKSLTNGLNGIIFCANEIDNEKLFNENTIIDLSRVGSSETKSFIMGLLTMRLQEHRMSTAEKMNQPLKHVTVLEEAHNLLKRTSTEQSSESSNLLGKSVEIIANAIAEMRTYGEGFIIADQAPGLLDMSAIRNTNTKIIMNLPDLSDRELVGKAVGLDDEQIVEIAKLPTGVGVIYQNKWLEAVLGKIEKYFGNTKEYKKSENFIKNISEKKIKTKILEILFSKPEKIEAIKDISEFKDEILKSSFELSKKINFLKIFEKENLTKNEVSHILYQCISNLDEILESNKNSKSLEEWNNNIIEKIKLEFPYTIDDIKFEILENIVLYYSNLENNNFFYNSWIKEMKGV